MASGQLNTVDESKLGSSVFEALVVQHAVDVVMEKNHAHSADRFQCISLIC